MKVYELVVRHFLACVSKDAEGRETTIEIDVNNERVILFFRIFSFPVFSRKIHLNIFNKFIYSTYVVYFCIVCC